MCPNIGGARTIFPLYFCPNHWRRKFGTRFYLFGKIRVRKTGQNYRTKVMRWCHDHDDTEPRRAPSATALSSRRPTSCALSPARHRAAAKTSAVSRTGARHLRARHSRHGGTHDHSPERHGSTWIANFGLFAIEGTCSAFAGLVHVAVSREGGCRGHGFLPPTTLEHDPDRPGTLRVLQEFLPCSRSGLSRGTEGD